MQREDNYDLLLRLKNEKNQIDEKNRDLIGAYMRWLVLPENKKTELRKAWKNYYRKVLTSDVKKLSEEMIKAIKTKNSEKIKSLRVKMAGVSLDEIKKPSSFDPELFTHSEVVRNYEQLSKRIEKLTKTTTAGNVLEAFAK